MRGRARHVRRQRGDVKLHVRCCRLRFHAGEDASLVDADGHGATARESVVEPDLERPPPASKVVVGRDRLGALEDYSRLEMILQIFADAGELVHDRNTEGVEQRGRADARKLQQLRGL